MASSQPITAGSSKATTSDSDAVVFTDDSLHRITDCLGNVYFRLGLLLQVARPYIEQLECKFHGDLWRLNFEVLAKWRDSCDQLLMVKHLIKALKALHLTDVVDIMRDEHVNLLALKNASLQKELKETQEHVNLLALKNASLQKELKETQEEVSRLKQTVKREASTGKAHLTRLNSRRKQHLLVVGGLTNKKGGEGNEDHSLCHYWAEESKCWQLLTQIPQSVDRLCDVCQLASDLLLLTGGQKSGVVEADCWLLDVVNTTWTQLPSLTTSRHFHRSVRLGDYVYVVGGKDVSKKVTGSVERFDLKQHHWSSLPDMPQPVFDPSVISYGHRVFVFGGRDADNKTLSCTQAYDTMSNKWLTLAATPTACVLGAVVSVNRFIYLVGGFSRSCLRYDPASDSWTGLSQPHQEHGNAPAVVWQGGILVSGCGGVKPESAAIEHYNPVTDEWTNWQTPLKEKLTTHRMFSVSLSDV